MTLRQSSISNCITFRISVSNLDLLVKESQSKQVSLNTLAKQIVNEHLNRHSRAAQAKLHYWPKSFLIRVINQLTNEQLCELARNTAKNDLVDVSLFLRGEFTIASLSNIAETWLRISQMPYRCEVNADFFKIIIEHDMGYKYSYLIKEISRYLLDVAFGANTSCDITDNSVVIKLHS